MEQLANLDLYPPPPLATAYSFLLAFQRPLPSRNDNQTHSPALNHLPAFPILSPTDSPRAFTAASGSLYLR
jgi:hypothetical protein